MLSKLTKSALIILTVALCCVCVGSAFALYRVDATPIVISISAEVPAAPETISIKGSWDNWDALVNLSYSAGTYTLTRDFAASDRFKGYATTWFDGSDYTFTKAGNYTLSYPESGSKSMTDFTVTANSYTYTITANVNWLTSDGAVLLVWVFGGSGSDTDRWVEVTTVNSTTFTVTLPTSYTGAKLVRHKAGTTTANANFTAAGSGGTKWNEATNDMDLTSTSSVNAYFS